MMELVEANWLVFVIAFVIGIAVAWYLWFANRRTSLKSDRRDVLDEGAEPAARNQALIDAPRRSQAGTDLPPPPAPPGLAGAGTAVAAAVEEQTAAAQASVAEGDDLTQIKGIGPKLAMLLNSLGVHRFADIAGWNDDDIDRIDAQLGRFEGRIRRDDWVEQARLLAAGDRETYQSRFGNL